MRILSEREFSIVPREESISDILLNGVKTGTSIEGACLELVTKCRGGYLVIMTDDIPYEDSLHIHLLDDKAGCIDSANIGAMYSTGSFENPVIEGENCISFQFIGDTRWKVELLGYKEWRIPFFSSPKGVSRRHPFYQYFRVYDHPNREKAL